MSLEISTPPGSRGRNCETFLLVISKFGRLNRGGQLCSLHCSQARRRRVTSCGWRQMNMFCSNGNIAPYYSGISKFNDNPCSRFGQYRSSRNATPTPCIVLLMAHKTTKKARIVLGNQSWITVQQYSGIFSRKSPLLVVLTITRRRYIPSAKRQNRGNRYPEDRTSHISR